MHTYTLRALTEDCGVLSEETLTADFYTALEAMTRFESVLSTEDFPFSVQLFNTESGAIIAESFFDN